MPGPKVSGHNEDHDYETAVSDCLSACGVRDGVRDCDSVLHWARLMGGYGRGEECVVSRAEQSRGKGIVDNAAERELWDVEI